MLVPAYARDGVAVHQGDVLDVLAVLPDESVDAVATDPPYALGILGAEWDTAASPVEFGRWCEAWARECLRVLKPGGHLVAFGGSRTWHRLAVGVEDAGFEIRDNLAWIYGSGSPKGTDAARAIDRRRDDRADVLAVTAWLAAARDAAGWSNRQIDAAFGFNGMANHWTTQRKLACVPSVEQWRRLRELLGFGDELDDEVARLNSRKGEPGDAWHTREVVAVESRVRGTSGDVPIFPESTGEYLVTAPATDAARLYEGWHTALKGAHEPAVLARKPLIGGVAHTVTTHGTGALNVAACRVGEARRWPPNVLLGHAPQCADECAELCPLVELDHQAPGRAQYFPVFRYQAKAPTRERPRLDDGTAHPTVKPLALMRWLLDLVTPPGGLVLDPFAGSGTTAQAALAGGFRCLAIERDPAYIRLIRARLDADPPAARRSSS